MLLNIIVVKDVLIFMRYIRSVTCILSCISASVKLSLYSYYIHICLVFLQIRHWGRGSSPIFGVRFKFLIALSGVGKLKRRAGK